jgi:hypothetical protein
MTSAGTSITRRSLLGTAGLGGLALLSTPALAQRVIELSLPGGPDTRPITTKFPPSPAPLDLWN